MLFFEFAPVLLLAVMVGAEKKIELQDIEDDNLKSERGYKNTRITSEHDGTSHYSVSSPYQYHKFENTIHEPQPSYVDQHAVTEKQDVSSITPKPVYGLPVQQAVVSYLSSVPMQIFPAPLHYHEVAAQSTNTYLQPQHLVKSVTEVRTYPTAETLQTETKYLNDQGYAMPTRQTYVQPYNSPVSYLYSAPPTSAPIEAAIAPLVPHQHPVIHYQTTIEEPSIQHKPINNYDSNSQYIQNNVVEENDQENHLGSVDITQNEEPYIKSHADEVPNENTQALIREDFRHGPELPHPNPLLLKGAPSHLAHLPKVLPMHRPLTQSVYNGGTGNFVNRFIPRPREYFSTSFRRKPTSLLDSYVPSSIQIELLKRGIIRDPLVAYEALLNRKYLDHNLLNPSHYEGGFLPNQMFHTAGGGTFYGHYKRSPKITTRGSKKTRVYN